MKLFTHLPALLLVLLLASCSTARKSTKASSTPPPADREFRAAWVATVANINWPSKPGLSTAQQQAEALALLDFLKTHHFNAVIFQVRPQADALYASRLEPWSYYLTGVQGKAPEPFYDPLQFWIDAAHNRGLELHVWLNPYRAHHPVGGPLTDSSVVKKKPELVLPLKEGYWWFDPALKGTQDHAAAVVQDLVQRYDIDGVHFDDYFYPYPAYNKNEDFPDSASWEAYKKSGGTLSRADWRRDAVNNFISRLYREIKETKQHVKFGLSPFGIWRPGHPAAVSGFDQYEVLYADARLWLNRGWIDYFSPQLYWPIGRLAQSFPLLLGWWNSENKKGRHLWPGINVGTDTTAAGPTEVVNEIMVSRGMLAQSPGVVHWSIGQVYKNPRIAQALVQGPYKKEALVPASPWLDKIPPALPGVQTARMGDSIRVSFNAKDESDVFRWVVYARYDKNWEYHLLNRSDRHVLIPAKNAVGKLEEVVVGAVDRMGNEQRTKGVLLPPDGR